MARRIATWVGAALAVAGFIAGLGAIALPWATVDAAVAVPGAGQVVAGSGSVPILNFDLGSWYLLGLGVCAGLLAGAAAAGWPARARCGAFAILAGMSTCLLAVLLAERVTGDPSVTTGTATTEVDGAPGLDHRPGVDGCRGRPGRNEPAFPRPATGYRLRRRSRVSDGRRDGATRRGRHGR